MASDIFANVLCSVSQGDATDNKEERKEEEKEEEKKKEEKEKHKNENEEEEKKEEEKKEREKEEGKKEKEEEKEEEEEEEEKEEKEEKKEEEEEEKEGEDEEEEEREGVSDVMLEQICALSYFDGLKWIPIQTSTESHGRGGVVTRITQLNDPPLPLLTNPLHPPPHPLPHHNPPSLHTPSHPPPHHPTSSSTLDGSSNRIRKEVTRACIEGFIFEDEEQSATSSTTLLASSQTSSSTLTPSSVLPTAPPQTPPATPATLPLPRFAPSPTRTSLGCTLYNTDPQPPAPTLPCVKQITTHDYGEMYSIFHEIPQPVLWLKARILTQYNTQDPFYHHILTNCSELRPGPWSWNSSVVSRRNTDATDEKEGEEGGGEEGGRGEKVAREGKEEGRREKKKEGRRGGIERGGARRVCVETLVTEMALQAPVEHFVLVT